MLKPVPSGTGTKTKVVMEERLDLSAWRNVDIWLYDKFRKPAWNSTIYRV